MADLPSKKATARRRGRVFGILVFAAIVTAFIAVCSVEIIVQAWAKPPAPSRAASPKAASPNVLLPESR